MTAPAHEYRSLVLRFAADDDAMQDRLDKELTALSNDGWELGAFTTHSAPGGDAPVVLHTFVFRRGRMAGPRGGG
jgi:hypothetical protein